MGKNYTVTYLLLFVGLILFSKSALSQDSFSSKVTEHQYVVEHKFTTNNGLPANGINSVYQDRDGYIWAATFNGLVRFNGSEFKVYDISNLKNLSSNRFTAVNEDHEGNIWAGLELDGFVKIDLRADTAIVYSLDQKELQSRNSKTTEFIFDPDNTPWIGTDRGLLTIKNGEILLLDELPAKPVIRLHFRAGYLYVGYDDEIIRLNPNDLSDLKTIAEVKNEYLHFQNDSLNLGQNNIPFTDFNFKENDLYLLVPDGLIRYHQKAEWLFSRDNVKYGSFYGFLSKDGAIYVYGNDGIFRTSLNSSEFVQYNKMRVLDLIVDHEGSLWAATSSDGIIQLVYTQVYMGDYYQRLDDQGITAVLKGMDGSVYIAPNCDGIYKYQEDRIRRFGYDDGLSTNCVWSLMQEVNGTLWAGTWGHGIYYKEPRSNIFKEFTPQLFEDVGIFLSIFEDSNNHIWFGTYFNGLYRLTDSEIQPVTSTTGETLAAVRMILESQNGDIYVASDDGIGIFHENEIHTIQSISELGISNFRTIAQDSTGRLWFGSYGEGMVVYSPGEEPSLLSTEDGLIDNTISQLAFDEDGDLWLGGNKGIFYITKAEVENFLDGVTNELRVSRIGVEEGMTIGETNGGFMPSSQFTGNGELLIPTVKGVTVINTRDIEINDKPPNVVIEQVTIDGQPFNPSQVESISYDSYRIIFRFAGLSFKNPDHNRYEYMLEGFDEDWISANNNNEAIYTRIPSGDYQFKVRASNNDGVWSTESATISFSVEPPFWRTSWFYICITVLTGILIYIIYRFRVRRIRKYNRELKQTVESRTKELQNHIEDKNKLQAILAHDLRNPFTGILGYIELIKDDFEKKGDQEQVEMLNLLLDSGRNTAELLENLLEWSSSDNGGLEVKFSILDIVELVDNTISSTEAQSSFKNITVKSLIEETHYVWADKNMIKTVLRNLISNAIKFSPNDSIVEISLKEKEVGNKVIISVSDNGVGIPLEKQEILFSSNKSEHDSVGTRGEKGTGLGLKLCKEFIDKHEEEIWVSSKLGYGTTVYFSLKKVSKPELKNNEVLHG